MAEPGSSDRGSERDQRSTVPPAERPPEEQPEHGDEDEAHGPLGNPASDEETLSHRQQEKAQRPQR
jgi:hypothetical protein